MFSRRIDLVAIAAALLGCTLFAGCHVAGSRWSIRRSHGECRHCRQNHGGEHHHPIPHHQHDHQHDHQYQPEHLQPPPGGGYDNGEPPTHRRPRVPQVPPASPPSAPPSLPRIPMPETSGGGTEYSYEAPRRATLMERVKFGLQKLNPWPRSNEPPQSPHTTRPPQHFSRPHSSPELRPIPEPRLPRYDGPTAGLSDRSPAQQVATRSPTGSEPWPRSHVWQASGNERETQTPSDWNERRTEQSARSLQPVPESPQFLVPPAHRVD